jgi:hypothetical protein
LMKSRPKVRIHQPPVKNRGSVSTASRREKQEAWARSYPLKKKGVGKTANDLTRTVYSVTVASASS